ncbi:hypothetical protein [Knoellia sp. p5-6-4]|uniref:hypothetical protein n=1 Tax=unclassified Knoellia TaxID=2618719 RepID=UPI0023DBC1AB|nr:hypothetical protein [Knoellia sp. p5-6-4]MDF2143723.1 hypothetical protein [Knoellia sp. p5-6-4]
MSIKQGVTMRAISHRVSRITWRRAPRSGDHVFGAEVLPAAEDLRHVPTTERLPPPERLLGLEGAEADGLLITRQRAGLYVLSDASGQVVGRISGDYVVGFTAEYRGASELYEDLEEAKATIAELHAREAGLTG